MEQTNHETILKPTAKIGPEEVRQAARILKRYKQGKRNLEQRIIDNEQFWKLRHWEQMEHRGEGGNSADVRAELTSLLSAVLGIGANRIYITAAKV